MKEYIINSPKNGTRIVLLDDKDYDYIIKNNIRLYIKYHPKIKDCYAYISGGKYKGQCLHRLLMNFPKDLVVDHINHNPLDNRRCNLRIVTDIQNKQNRKDNTSGILGVDKYKNKWRAQLQVRGKKYIKYYNTKEEAIKGRKLLERLYFS